MTRPSADRVREPARGFTLVELMVVVAIVGVLATLAVVFINPRSFAATPRGYAQEIAALCDSVRQRAVASRTFQRLEVEGERVLHWQATTAGIAPPVEYELVGTIVVPSQVVIAAVSDRTHVQPDDAVPAAGVGLPAEIDFSPDGSSQSATIFIADSNDRNRARIAIYRATGSAYAYQEW